MKKRLQKINKSGDQKYLAYCHCLLTNPEWDTEAGNRVFMLTLKMKLIEK